MYQIISLKCLCIKQWLARSVIFVSIFVISATTKGENKVDALYNLTETKALQPQVFDLGLASSLSLFAVPQGNAIGTNDLSNAITFLSFSNDRVTYDKYFKNAVHDVEGGGEYIPIVSQNVIGFGQTRRFLLYDFKSKICRNYQIVSSLEKTIEKIAIANAEQRHFIFEIEAHNRKSQDPWDYTSYLLLMDLSATESEIIKQISIGKGETWSVAFDKIFLYDIGKDVLRVLTTHFEPAQHPLVDVISKNKATISFTRIHPHPYLPFAILEAGRKDEVLVFWGEKDKAPTSLFGKGTTVTQFSFSPDGRWVVFKRQSLNKNQTYLMAISEKYPHFVGSPILLSNHHFNENNYGWTTNPISFVGSRLSKIYRWELTNAAHPESDKATFWDFIVEQDLERLTKEKRQGLGEK